MLRPHFVPEATRPSKFALSGTGAWYVFKFLRCHLVTTTTTFVPGTNATTPPSPRKFCITFPIICLRQNKDYYSTLSTMHAFAAKLVILLSSFIAVNALAPNNRNSVDDSVSSRRSLLKNSAASIFSIGAIASTQIPRAANASYSAYTNRENDWDKRVEKGEVKISSARDLKAQLREIAPMNAQSEIFCPNGPSSNVSPMMENKCSKYENKLLISEERTSCGKDDSHTQQQHDVLILIFASTSYRRQTGHAVCVWSSRRYRGKLNSRLQQGLQLW